MKSLIKWGCISTLAAVGLMICLVVISLITAASPEKQQEGPVSIAHKATISEPPAASEPSSVVSAVGVPHASESIPEHRESPTASYSKLTTRRTPTVIPFPTSEAKKTPYGVTPTKDVSLILYVPDMLGKSVQEIEAEHGPGADVARMPAGAIDSIPEGGEMRTYTIGKYVYDIAYDLSGIARGFQVMEGLLEDGYSLDQWAMLLDRFGFSVSELPNVQAPAGVRWDDFHGYRIELFALSPGGPVWSVKIWRPKDGEREVAVRETPRPTFQPYVQIKSNPVNIRQGPDTSFPVVGKMQEGDRYTLVGKTPDQQWWQICCINGDQAWVAAWVVEAIGDLDKVPIAQEIPTPPSIYLSVDIRDLDAYTEDHVGKKVKLEGKVFNIGKDFLQIHVKKPGGSSWDTVPVTVTFLKIQKPKGIYEDTRIQVFGEVIGRIEGTNAFGGQINQVWIDAEMVKQLDGRDSESISVVSRPTPITPQNLPQIGQMITTRGWEFKVYDVKKRKAVYFYEESYIAYGHFLIVFIEAVNRNPGTASFSDLDPYVADLAGNVYEESIKGSIYAQWQYEGLGSYYDDVNPGNLIKIVHAYDLPDTTGDVILGLSTGERIYLGNFSAKPSEDG